MRSWFAAAALLVPLLAGCDRGKAAPTQEVPPTPVTTAPAAARRVERAVEVLGTLHGEAEATISNKVTGRIRGVLADVGSVVSGGAPLLELEPEDFQRAVQTAEWALRQSLARLGTAELPGDTFDIDAAPSVVRARAQLENEKSRLARLAELARARGGVVSEQDVKDAETTVAVAAAGLDQERLTLRALVAETHQRAADLETARSRLADARVLAPPGGPWAVAARRVSVGEYVREGTALFELVTSDPLLLRARVPERYSPVVRVDQAVTLQVEAFGERAFPARVARVNPTVDADSRTFGIEAVVENAGGELRPGAFARASLVVGTEEVVVVPLDAVVSFAGIDKVFLVEGGKAVERLVKVGGRVGDAVEVTGLPAGAEVVVTGQTVLTQGAPVALAPPPPPAGTPR
jgi:RND family efflux transporter MFP subunit